MLAGYDHLLRAARRLAWDDDAIDLAADATGWPALPEAQRTPIAALVAGFCVAESAVAEHLAPFEAAAEDPDLAACFAAQADDERRHARFFARVATEVCAIADPRAMAGPGVCALFQEELPARAAALAAGTARLGDAVALYHLVLEGVAFHAGQQALLTLLDDAATLPGVREGVVRVQGDERWHVGLGVRCLQDAALAPPADLDALAARAAACWPAAVDASAALAVHRRRLGVLVGTLAPCAPPAASSSLRS